MPKDPSKPKILFRSPRHPKTEVHLNWAGDPDEKMDFYGRAFHAAGRMLVAKYDGTNCDRDYAALPIVYLYRHALELVHKRVHLGGPSASGGSSEDLNRPESLGIPPPPRSHA